MAATLSERMQCTRHCSVLDFKVRGLQSRFPDPGAASVEDWLLDVANQRGATVVFRQRNRSWETAPSREDLSDEELVTAILLLGRKDEPQLIRLAAQLISRGEIALDRLLWLARLERIERSLKALATQALRVEPEHGVWQRIFQAVQDAPDYREPLLHWTRLAEPQMQFGKPGAQGWKLVR